MKDKNQRFICKRNAGKLQQWELAYFVNSETENRANKALVFYKIKELSIWIKNI